VFILLCHEMGHWFACRRHRVAATPPYFLPAPFGFGTLGAFIRIRQPLRSRPELFDIGIAGPIAGAVALLPFLVLGAAWSTPAAVSVASEPSGWHLLVPGRGLAMSAALHGFHGAVAPGTVWNLHPFALAAWVGLLATALNLMPLGQLDGGHILYAVVGRKQHRLAWPLWGLLAGLGLVWPGWVLWSVIVLAVGLKHPPIADETTPLGPRRRLLAWLALALLALTFVPAPLEDVAIAEPPFETTVRAAWIASHP
jgi:membrane-associated protease RseP (regulator of RpoE activity)